MLLEKHTEAKIYFYLVNTSNKSGWLTGNIAAE
jgi:hypothetical protein